MAMVFGSASSAYAARIDFMTSNPCVKNPNAIALS
jgi:hypothetical protein